MPNQREVEKPFILTALVCLVTGSLWLWVRHGLLLEYFYSAEMLALTQAFAAAGEKRLEDCEVYCSLEPCLQCAGALLHARVRRVVYAAADPKFGGVESLARTWELPGLNHRIESRAGLLAEESAALLREFFRARR